MTTDKDDHLVFRYVRADDDRKLVARGAVLFSLFAALFALDLVHVLTRDPGDAAYAGYVAWGTFCGLAAAFLGVRMLRRWRRTRASPLRAVPPLVVPRRSPENDR